MGKYNYDRSQWAEKRPCPYCGHDYYPTHVNDDYCSHSCESDYADYCQWVEDMEMDSYYRRQERELRETDG